MSSSIIPEITSHPQNFQAISQHRSVGATGDIVYQQPQTRIYTNLMNNESPPNSGQNQLYNPIGQNLINSAKPIMPSKMSAWDRKHSEDAGSLLAGGDSLQQRSKNKHHNSSYNNNQSKRKKSIKFPPNLLHPSHNRFLSQNIVKNTFRNQGVFTQNLITRDYSPNATMPSVINTSVKGVSIERSTLGNQLTILKLKDQVKMLKEETHQLTQLNFRLCDENEMLQEENQSLGGTGAIEKNQLLSTNIMQGSMPGAPHKFDSPNARVKYFEKRNAHNKASLKVKSIMNQTVLQAERREYKQNIKEIMEKSQQQIEELRQTLCKQNDDTLQMLAQSTRKLVQLEQQKNILMANLAFVKEEFQKFASSQTKKPIKKPNLLSQNRLSPTGNPQNNQVQEQDDEDQDQDPELLIEQMKGKIKQLQLDKDDLQQQTKEKDKQLLEKNKTIQEYQNKYNQIDIDILHEQINHLKSQNEILQKEKKLLQNPSKEQQQQEQGEEEQDVSPQEEKVQQAAGQQEIKQASKAKELAAKYMEK